MWGKGNKRDARAINMTQSLLYDKGVGQESKDVMNWMSMDTAELEKMYGGGRGAAGWNANPGIEAELKRRRAGVGGGDPNMIAHLQNEHGGNMQTTPPPDPGAISETMTPQGIEQEEANTFDSGTNQAATGMFGRSLGMSFKRKI